MTQAENDMRQIGLRIEGLREACDVTREDMARELGVDLSTYTQWEQTGQDVPISAIYHMAHKFGVEFTEIVSGSQPRLDTIQVVRAHGGKASDRNPEYHLDDLAWRFQHKIMQPLMVYLDPCSEPAEMVAHSGQEFNYVVEGTVILTFNGRDYTLEAGDCAYFNPTYPHGQRCGGETTARFLTVIAEDD